MYECVFLLSVLIFRDCDCDGLAISVYSPVPLLIWAKGFAGDYMCLWAYLVSLLPLARWGSVAQEEGSGVTSPS